MKIQNVKIGDKCKFCNGWKAKLEVGKHVKRERERERERMCVWERWQRRKIERGTGKPGTLIFLPAFHLFLLIKAACSGWNG